MTKKTPFIVITVILLLFVGISLSMSFSLKRETAPVPPNIKMDPTVASQPEEARLLLGKWAGQWNSSWAWDCVLYVEKVEGKYAQVVHSWGEYTTSRMSCHCAPNWARVLEAKVNYREGKATIDFITPGYETGHFRKKRHILSGEDEGWVGRHAKSHGHYAFSFTVDKSEPDIMKGRFISGKGSHLNIVMKRLE